MPLRLLVRVRQTRSRRYSRAERAEPTTSAASDAGLEQEPSRVGAF